MLGDGCYFVAAEASAYMTLLVLCGQLFLLNFNWYTLLLAEVLFGFGGYVANMHARSIAVSRGHLCILGFGIIG